MRGRVERALRIALDSRAAASAAAIEGGPMSAPLARGADAPPALPAGTRRAAFCQLVADDAPLLGGVVARGAIGAHLFGGAAATSPPQPRSSALGAQAAAAAAGLALASVVLRKPRAVESSSSSDEAERCDRCGGAACVPWPRPGA